MLRTFKGHQTVKQLTETLAVLHPEADLIIIDGESGGFRYNADEGDSFHIDPVCEAINIASAIHLRPLPLQELRFIRDGRIPLGDNG